MGAWLRKMLAFPLGLELQFWVSCCLLVRFVFLVMGSVRLG